MHWVKGSGIDSPPPRFNYKGQVLSAGWVTTFGTGEDFATVPGVVTAVHPATSATEKTAHVPNGTRRPWTLMAVTPRSGSSE